jgi:hypothetical protein
MSNDFCAIVFIGGGSSWAWSSDKNEAAAKAVKRCRIDWKQLYQFKKGANVPVTILDMKERNGWYAGHRGIFDDTTHEQIKPMEIINITV